MRIPTSPEVQDLNIKTEIGIKTTGKYLLDIWTGMLSRDTGGTGWKHTGVHGSPADRGSACGSSNENAFSLPQQRCSARGDADQKTSSKRLVLPTTPLRAFLRSVRT